MHLLCAMMLMWNVYENSELYFCVVVVNKALTFLQDFFIYKLLCSSDFILECHLF